MINFGNFWQHSGSEQRSFFDGRILISPLRNPDFLLKQIDFVIKQGNIGPNGGWGVRSQAILTAVYCEFRLK